MRAGGTPFGQMKHPLKFCIIPGTKFFAKLSPKESGEKSTLHRSAAFKGLFHQIVVHPENGISVLQVFCVKHGCVDFFFAVEVIIL